MSGPTPFLVGWMLIVVLGIPDDRLPSHWFLKMITRLLVYGVALLFGTILDRIVLR